jgi:hypothetical protein
MVTAKLEESINETELECTLPKERGSTRPTASLSAIRVRIRADSEPDANSTATTEKYALGSTTWQ